MAVGKNKKVYKKKAGRKVVDPFKDKEWFDVKAPSVFPIRQIGKTMGTKTKGTKLVRDSLVGRVFEVSLGDLKPNGEDDAFRLFKLKAQELQGTTLLTQFHGMDMTTDKLRSLVRKWHTLVEAHADIKTTDGYYLRLHCIGFTKRRPNQTRKTSYAKGSQVRTIRRKMVEIMKRESDGCDLTELTTKLIPEIIGREIEKATVGVYPLQNVFVRKVKTLKAPKTDITRLLEAHGGAAVVTEDKGAAVEREE